MKKQTVRFVTLMLVVSLLLWMVGSTTAEQAVTAARERMNAYQEVLLGKRTYTQCNLFDRTEQTALFSTGFTQWYGYDFNLPMKYTTFCISDLDADGLPEMILSLSDDFGFELLRYENGIVYGFPFTYRAMEDITLEGDLYGSNGAADNEWYRVRFKADQMEQAVVCEMRSTDGGDPEHYWIGDREVTEDDYDAYCEQMKQKARPVWLDFTVQNIQAVVSKF